MASLPTFAPDEDTHCSLAPASGMGGMPVASDASPAGTFVRGLGPGDLGPREPGAPVMWEMTPASAGDSVGAGLDNSPHFRFACSVYMCYTSIKTLVFKNMIFIESH